MSDLSHGLLLQEQGRLDEAEACFYSVLARDPENDFVYSRLALCQLNQEGKRKVALQSIEEAIRIRPDEAAHYAIKSLILSDLRRGKEAVVASEQAIALDPEDAFALTTKARAYLALERWADAEEWSRKALAMDGDQDLAANILTNALRLQGKKAENQMAAEHQLAENPEDSFAHVNMGWSALQRGDHAQAETHFKEALRLDPENEMAREGLIESFRARSLFYRAYLSYCFFMQRHTAGKQWAIVIGLYVAYRLLSSALKNVSPLLAGGLGFLWLALVMWVWLAPGVGNFLILMDRSARYALKKGEKWQGIAVGGGLALGAIAVAGGFVLGAPPAILGGIGLIVSTIPASLALDNDSKNGRWLFGGLLVGVYLATLTIVILESFFSIGKGMHPLSSKLFTGSLIVAFACTWLGGIRGLRQEARE